MTKQKKKTPCPECGEEYIRLNAHMVVHDEDKNDTPEGLGGDTSEQQGFTQMQLRAIEHYVNSGCKSLSESMRQAGYSESSAKACTRLKQSKGWKELMDKYIPESKLAQIHSKLLEAEETVFMKQDGEVVKLTREDNQTIRAALNMGYKLHGSYAPEKIEMAKRQLSEMTDDELEREILEAKKQLGTDDVE